MNCDGCGRGSMAVTLLRRGWWPRCRRFRRSRSPTRTGLRQAEQMMRRCETADQLAEFGMSLNAGRVSGAHVDVLARTLRQVEPEVRDKLIEQASSLVLTDLENLVPL